MTGITVLQLFIYFLGFIIELVNQSELEHKEENIYRYKHTSIRDVIYNTMKPDEKKMYHKLAGEVIELEYKDNLGKYVDILIHHFHEAEITEKYQQYLLESVLIKIENMALDKAKQHIDQFFNEGFKDPRALKALGDYYNKKGDYKEALESYDEVFDDPELDESLLIKTEISRINSLIMLS